jgi:hypothetical protein
MATPFDGTFAESGLTSVADHKTPSGLSERRTYIIDLTEDESDLKSRQTMTHSTQRQPLLASSGPAPAPINPQTPKAFATTNGVHPLSGAKDVNAARSAKLSISDRKRLVLNAFHRHKLPTESQLAPSSPNERSAATAPKPVSKAALKRESLQVPPSYPPIKTVEQQARQQSPCGPSSTTPNFDASCLPRREIGEKYSDAEKILLIYLFEEKRFQSHVVDRMLGRKYKNNGSGCYSKWHQGLKKPRTRKALNLNRNMTALKQIMTLNWPILATCEALDEFLVSGVLPAGLKLPHNPTWVPSAPRHNSTGTVAWGVQAFAKTPVEGDVGSAKQHSTTVQPSPLPGSRLTHPPLGRTDSNESSHAPSSLSIPQSHILANNRQSGDSILREDTNDSRGTESARLAAQRINCQAPGSTRTAARHGSYDMSLIEPHCGQKRESHTMTMVLS